MGRRSKPNRHPTSGWWRFTYRGHVYWRRSQAEAEKTLAQLVGSDRRRSQIVYGVAGLVDTYLAHTGDDPLERGLLKTFAVFAVGQPLQPLDRNLLIDYAAHLESLARKPWTVQKKVRLARKVLAWGQRRGHLENVPDWPRLPTPIRHPRGLPANAIAGILDDLAGTPAEPLARFILATGCRPAEACKLRWGQIQLDRRVAILIKHKTAGATGRPRTIYLTPEALTILADLPCGVDTDPIFRSSRGQPFSPAGLRSAIRRAAMAALGKPSHPYALRHTFAQVASRHVPVDHLAKLMGHRSIVTTQHYYQVEDQTALEAASQVPSIAPPSPLSVPGSAPGVRARPRKSKPGSTRARNASGRAGELPAKPAEPPTREPSRGPRRKKRRPAALSTGNHQETEELPCEESH